MAKKQVKFSDVDVQTPIDNIVDIEELERSSYLGLGLIQSQRLLAPLRYHTRLEEYKWRTEASRDGLIKFIISSHLINAIGTKNRKSLRCTAYLSKEVDVSDKLREMINDELNIIMRKIDRVLTHVSKDALLYGDGYAFVKSNEKGVEIVGYNFTTKPYNVISYLSNYGRSVGYEISNTFLHGGAKKTPLKFKEITNNELLYNRRLIKPDDEITLARLSYDDGSIELQDATLSQIGRMNPFHSREYYYADTINGGILEGVREAYEKYKNAINASVNARIASSVIERWITQSANNTTPEERKQLREAMKKRLNKITELIRNKQDKNDPLASLVTHYLLTTTDNATGGIDIQESDINFKDTMDDVIFHVKRLVGNMKYHIDLTSFSESQQGGREPDSVARASEVMEEVANTLRDGIIDFVHRIISLHFLKKYNVEFKDIDKDIMVEFNSVVFNATKESEFARMDAMQNTTQFNQIIGDLKGWNMKDSKENREVLYEVLKDITPKNTANSEEFIKNLSSVIFQGGDENQGENE